MKKILISALLFLGAGHMAAKDGGYQFRTVKSIPVTSVKDQASTGTCWCFATTSFMEAELLRMGKGEHDLSEMFIVRQKYLNQADDNFLRRGNGNMGEGSLSHTWMNAYRQVGIVPEEVYHGINYASERHNHHEMAMFVKAIADVAMNDKHRSTEYYKILNNVFDTYLGTLPQSFTYQGKTYTSQSFASSLGLNMDDYVEITSFSHKPFYQPFSLEVPDNWEHALQYNVPLDEMMEVIDHALNKGYTVCWDGDVSERGFSHSNGVAIIPETQKVDDLSGTDRARWENLTPQQRQEEAYKFKAPCPEVHVTQELRQLGYEHFVTTDDHLMHITGIVTDQNGTKYYVTKNSWGEGSNDMGGYLNMSESYVRGKTIYVMLHKDALPAQLRKKLGI